MSLRIDIDRRLMDLVAWRYFSRVSADGLCPAVLARGGSKGPFEGPFLVVA